MSYGLTSSGFVVPTVQEIIDAITAEVLANINANLDTSPDQPIGQLIGIWAEKIVEVWEVVATIYNQMDPDAAEGYLLDALSALTGTRRRSATYSTVVANLNLNASTTVPAGAVVAVNGQPANTWVLEANVTNSGGSPAVVQGTFRSTLPGPFVANAGTLTVIQTPVSGWNTVTNPADAALGINVDTDATLRVRRQAELSAAGSSTVDAIRADVLEVAGVIQAFVLENNKDATDLTTGLPPHSFDVIVWDGPGLNAVNTDIAQAIWNDKPTGIQTVGGTSAIATDSTGASQTVHFDRAQQLPLYIDVTLTTDSTFPPTGYALVQAAIAAYVLANINLGQSVIAERLKAVCFSVQGVVDVPLLKLGFAPSPSGTLNLSVSQFQIATLNSANVSAHA